MSSSVLLACEILEDELLLALERTLSVDRRPPLVWVESGLHAKPENLQRALQGLIDRLDEGNYPGSP